MIAGVGIRFRLNNDKNMEGTIAEIRLFAGNFAPRNWAYCSGQLMAINSNTALFSLVGTTYGGDGRTTFGLPDLRGRVAVAPGLHPGSAINYQRGMTGGAERHTLSLAEMPNHNHLGQIANPAIGVQLKASDNSADEESPEDAVLADSGQSNYTQTAPNVNMNANAATATMADPSVSVQYNGGSQPHNNIQPFQVINYIICLQGVYPTRS